MKWKGGREGGRERRPEQRRKVEGEERETESKERGEIVNALI